MADAAGAEERRSPIRLDARSIVGGTIICLVLLAAVFAPLIAPHDPLEQDLLSTLLPPSFAEGGDPLYLFGTDSLGRDILSRLIYAAQIAVIVALVAASLARLIGST